MSNSTAREEQLRSNRRLARQILGGVTFVFILIGVLTVLGWIVGGVRKALDNSGEMEKFEDEVYGLVIFDTPAFDDVSGVDQGIFKQAAIWSCVYLAQKNEGSLDSYERDAETGSVMLPQLEVDTYLTNLLGKDYEITEGSFTTNEFNYYYDEASQCYLVPVTGSVALYTPKVVKVAKSGKTKTVTVGYVPTLNNTSGTELSLTAPTEPTKYMDYVFTKTDGGWCLTALQNSEMKVESTATPVPTEAAIDDPQAMVADSLNESSDTAEERSGEDTSTEGEDAAVVEDDYEIGADGPGDETGETTEEATDETSTEDTADEEQKTE